MAAVTLVVTGTEASLYLVKVYYSRVSHVNSDPTHDVKLFCTFCRETVYKENGEAELQPVCTNQNIRYIRKKISALYTN